MKILNAKQLKIVDQETIQTEGISSWELMERASSIVTQSILSDFENAIKKSSIVVVCGKGNNGGDGLAIARQLSEFGCDVQVRLLQSDQYTPDNLLNQGKLDNIQFFGLHDSLNLPQRGFLIDCLFGYGLSAALSQEWAHLIDQINRFQGEILSVDMPSGLMLEAVGTPEDQIVKATKVYTFQSPKLSLLIPNNSIFVEKFEILDIGLNQNSISNQQSNYHYVEQTMLEILVRKRSKFSHKGTYGHVAIVGGSLGKMGAVLMSSRAALRSGCGLLTAYIPKCGCQILQIGLTEAMVLVDSGEQEIEDFNLGLNYAAYGIGVGMGKDEKTVQGFEKWLLGFNRNGRLLLDADALNILAKNVRLLRVLPPNTVLTPHPKELSRLIGEWENDFDKLQKAQKFACEYQVIVVIKGAHTAIVGPSGDIFFNSTGNAGMATAGTGDVLTGVISSLLGQGYDSLDAAVLGVFVHGLAGDYAKQWVGEVSLMASDVIDNLPSVFMDLER